MLGDELHQAGRLVGVELIDDEDPFALWIGVDVRRMWARKSASVRVSPMEGVVMRPVAISKLAISACVPWRSYSNSTASGCPGPIGRLG